MDILGGGEKEMRTISSWVVSGGKGKHEIFKSDQLTETCRIWLGGGGEVWFGLVCVV